MHIAEMARQHWRLANDPNQATTSIRIYYANAAAIVQRVNQSDIVENKRLCTTLELIKKLQDDGQAKTYTQRRRRTALKNSPIAALPGQRKRTSLTQ
jgi:hypothetical protein